MILLAPVNKIIPFSLVDGPGSRTSIFLQGCNISCAYCHNPETQRICERCGECIASCPAGALSKEGCAVVWDEAACVGCDACIKVCPHFASPKIRVMSPEDAFEVVRGYQPFIRGITVSGGECMLRPEWLRELFALCREAGLTTLIDSNGTIPFEAHPDLMDVTSGVMLDVKAWSPDVAQRLAGQPPELTENVKANLAFLADAGKLEEARIVVVDGRNDPEDIIDGMAEMLGEGVADVRLKLIRFRSFGVVGELAGAPSPDDARMDELAARARERGFGTVVIT